MQTSVDEAGGDRVAQATIPVAKPPAVSDWEFLNKHRVGPLGLRDFSAPSKFWSTPEDGFNGLFRFPCGGLMVQAMASCGYGWEHVSVIVKRSDIPPHWDIMCRIKNLFWGEKVWVAQFHPPSDQYVNNHKGCLHLWRPTEIDLPTPLSWMVGIKGLDLDTLKG